MRSFRILGLCLAVGLLLVPGCGGGSSAAPSAPDLQAPSALSYGSNPAFYTAGLQITPNTPSKSGGAVASYGVSPALPSGLTLSTSTGVISGTPGGSAPAATYTVTARNAAGSTSTDVNITIYPTDIGEALRATVGISGVTEVTSTVSGTRFFRFTLEQAVDHTVAGGPTFPQTLTLLYRSRTAPVVLATTGYSISLIPSQGEPTRILAANQITMEHRFFRSSTPSPVDWTKLSIQQAAADEHGVVLALKPQFSGKWLNTGGSKGGMTALFHRRFYPADVDATLAYVAPINLGNPDLRYIPFIDGRGDTSTRLAIEAWQQAILNKRSEVLALLQADAAVQGETLNYLGADKTLEFAVIESPFVLWQYGDAALAALVPPAGATSQALYDYLDLVNSGVVSSWGDSTLAYYQAYYQQCANQLGYPAVKESHLTGLSYPGQDLPVIYPPAGGSKVWEGPAAMQDIQTWLSNSAQNVILVYGENDPWTAGALDVPAGALVRGIRKYIAPAGNHGSKLATLMSSDASEAYSLLAQWLSTPVVPMAAGPLRPLREGRPDFAETFVVRRSRP